MKQRHFAILLLSAFAVGCDLNATERPTGPATTAAQDRDPPMPDESKMTQPNYEVAEVYTGLRDQVLQLEPGAIGQKDAAQATVYAVLMETGYPEAVATLVGVSDGTASLYFSNGGGIIGGGEHEPVRKVCGEFLRLAQDYVSKSDITDTFPLPKQGYVRCYLVTPGGVYTFEAPVDELGYKRHPCSPLFLKGHELITVIREYTSK
jgi:hypothetical protein